MSTSKYNQNSIGKTIVFKFNFNIVCHFNVKFNNVIQNNGNSTDTLTVTVINDGGVVGRVIEVGYLSSRVLLLTDVNSHIPVRLERTGDLAIVEGRNELLLDVKYAPPELVFEIGDRFLTSGHGGAYPPDLPVAVVLAVGEGRTIVRTTSAIDSLDYVRVMNYQPKLPEETLVDPEGEPVTSLGEDQVIAMSVSGEGNNNGN